MKNLGKKRKINRRGEGEREREREKGRNDPVVSNTPRRIRRTSNSSADRYEFLVDSRKGGSRRGPEGGRRGNGRGEVEGGWCLWGAGVD